MGQFRISVCLEYCLHNERQKQTKTPLTDNNQTYIYESCDTKAVTEIKTDSGWHFDVHSEGSLDAA